MKKLIMIVLIGLSISSLLTGCGNNIKEETNRDDIGTNTNEEIIKEQDIDVFKIENTSLVYINGTSTLETTITNTSNIDQRVQEFLIVFKDEYDVEIITLIGFVGDVIKAFETKVISSSCNEDLTKAKSIEYTVVK